VAEPKDLHKLKNHLSVIYSFADLLIGEMEDADPLVPTLGKIQREAHAALEILRRTDG
jgi:hypothetical protein